jgi:hypothetical protein
MSCPAVGHRFEFLVLDLEEVGDLIEYRRHLPVVQLLRHEVSSVISGNHCL